MTFRKGLEGSAERLSKGEGEHWGYCGSFEEVGRQCCLSEQRTKND